MKEIAKLKRLRLFMAITGVVLIILAFAQVLNLYLLGVLFLLMSAITSLVIDKKTK